MSIQSPVSRRPTARSTTTGRPGPVRFFGAVRPRERAEALLVRPDVGRREVGPDERVLGRGRVGVRVATSAG
jgi:hypothetical protein